MDERVVNVAGLKDLSRELKAIDASWAKELAQAAKKAAQIIVTEARSRASSAGGVLAKAADSIAPGGTQRGGYVRLGGPRWPYALGAEFGAKQYPQFKPWRGADENGGYALYPAIRDKTDEVTDAYGEMVGDLTRRAFPD